MTARYHDLRHASSQELERVLLANKDGVVLAATQIATLGRSMRDRDVVAVVPDFLEYARLLSVGQARQMLAKAGSLNNILRASAAAAANVLRHPKRAAATEFWLVAEALLAFDLALLGMFHGAVVLHPYLTDFALSLGHDRFLQRFAHAAAKWQYVGFWTYQLPLLLSSLARQAIAPAAVVFATAPHDAPSQSALESAKEQPLFKRTRFLCDCQPLLVGEADPIAHLSQRLTPDGYVLPK
jgi:hypothetical protein